MSFLTSQKGQDQWVLRTSRKLAGFFVDLAAADGIEHSNTYALERWFGWRGVCIEPNPDFLSSLRQRRSATIVDAVVSDREEDVVFRTDNGQLGGIVADDTDNNSAVRGHELTAARTMTRRTETLTDLLNRVGAPRQMDYLSLDVEGAEERVLRGLDFDRYQFQCLTIERPSPWVHPTLEGHGYRFMKQHRNDAFYVHSSLADRRHLTCEPFEQIPAKTW